MKKISPISDCDRSGIYHNFSPDLRKMECDTLLKIIFLLKLLDKIACKMGSDIGKNAC